MEFEDGELFELEEDEDDPLAACGSTAFPYASQVAFGDVGQSSCDETQPNSLS